VKLTLHLCLLLAVKKVWKYRLYPLSHTAVHSTSDSLTRTGEMQEIVLHVESFKCSR
jgi:hypothetical protein